MKSPCFIFEEARKVDSDNMYEVLKKFPDQLKEAVKIGDEAPVFKSSTTPEKILVLGMGGSAIGGDLIRSYSSVLPGADHLQVAVNRTYDIPNYIDSTWNVIASSYSGGTEETISGFTQAIEKTNQTLCITTGGSIGKIAAEKDIPRISIPAGLQPRCALGYSFFPLLKLMIKSGAYKEDAIKESEAAIEELIPMLEVKSKLYSVVNADNPAVVLACKLSGKIPVIYSSSEGLDSVNVRWRGQIQENAKNCAFGAFLPEMNHNEINGWSHPSVFVESGIPVFLNDPLDKDRVKYRFEALGAILEEKGFEVQKIKGEGDHFLTRMFDLLYLADWTSYYMAMINNVDPTPIPLINKLKNFLAGK